MWLAVACVLANWDNVLRAITMASSMFWALDRGRTIFTDVVFDSAKLAVPKDLAGHKANADNKNDTELSLPATLVRIPAIQQDKSSGQ